MNGLGAPGKVDFIKFDPEKIMDISMKLQKEHKRFNRSIINIKNKSETLKNTWQGDSSTLYLAKVNELNLQSEEMVKILLAFSKDLANASGIYRTGEASAKKKAEALPTDGVFLV